MERKEETKSFKDKENERFKEKIVYKVIPVPYYYPVPVDAEWYHKNYERQFRPTETTFPFVDPTNVEHFVPPPPPGFPFPRFRHPHHHFVHEPPNRRIPSPIPQTSHDVQPNTSSPKKKLENGCDDQTTHAVKINEDRATVENCVTVHAPNIEKQDSAAEDRNKETKNERFDEIIIKKEPDYSETIVVNGENPKIINEDNEIEAIRDRKRYLMTFPYDQKKKIKTNGQAEDKEKANIIVCEANNSAAVKPDSKETEVIRSETRYTTSAFPTITHGITHGIRYPTTHQTVMTPAVPYVMVPMQSPAFLHPTKIVHTPHFTSTPDRRLLTYEESSTLTPEILDGEFGDKSPDKDESDVRYHPNGRRARTVFTRQQLLTLNNVFEKHHFVSGERMSELSDQLGLDRKIVKIWFQNKRQYARKKGSLLEREEDYFEYQDRFNSGSTPPTMTMVNHLNYKLEDDLNYKINEEVENMNYKISDENINYKENETI